MTILCFVFDMILSQIIFNFELVEKNAGNGEAETIMWAAKTCRRKLKIGPWKFQVLVGFKIHAILA